MLAEEAEDIGEGEAEVRGFLCKWVNYLYGWQSRFIVLKSRFVVP
jgi:hypothetical protein